MKYFRPRKWDTHQHYKDRDPTWIKLHKALLHDYEFAGLTELQQCHLMKMWLLYAHVGKPLRWDCAWIARQIGADARALSRSLNALLSSNFIELVGEDASAELADGKQDARPEKETEKEKIQTPSESSAPCAPSPPVDLKSQVFGPCLDWLVGKTGKQEGAARKLVGKWCRDYGDGPALEALMAAQRVSTPVEPVAYIEKLLRTGGPRDGPHSQARQAAAEDEVDRMILEAAREADRRTNDQQQRTDHGAVEPLELGFRAANGEDHQRPAEPEVRRSGGGLRGIATALPALGTGGRH